jgi:tetratricopeptide (TPR) repeat protein
MSGDLPDTPRVRAAICVTLFLGTLLLFARALGHDFVNYDDPAYVTANAHVRAGLGLDGLRWAVTAGEASNWHPLTWLSHMLDSTLFGQDPRGHHSTSVLWHALNAAMAFLALRRLTGALWASATFAALFAWHPLRVESVAWVAERKDVLSGFFWFAVLWLYAGYVERRRAGGTGARKPYLATIAAFVLGLMAKPMLVSLPFVLLLLDVWPLRRVALGRTATARTAGARTPTVPTGGETWARVLVEKLPFVALAAASSLATYKVQQAGGSVSVELDFVARLANAVVAVARYLEKLLVPIDLAVLYPHPGTWPAPQVLAAMLLVGAITAIAVWQGRRRPWIAIGWCWFLGTLVPVAGLVQVGLQSMADRYTYVPMLGVQLAFLWTLDDAIVRPPTRRALAAVCVALLLGCSVATWRQLGVWRDSFTLFDHALAVTRNNYLAFDNRGLHSYAAGKVAEAMADYRQALAIRPDYMNANNNLGRALADQGRPAEALPFLRKALQARPENVEVRINLANALSDLGQLDEAQTHYDAILARLPTHASALNGSAVLLVRQNRLREAKARFEQALLLAPDNTSAHTNLGNLCAMLGDRDSAVRHYRRATELAPEDEHTLLLLGSLLNQQEEFAEAAQNLRRAIALRPTDADALTQLGLALARLGQRDQALGALRDSLRQRPDDAQTKALLESVATTPAGK